MRYAGRRVTVMGLGRFGGGVGVARFLAERDARVTVTDQASAEQLPSSIAQLADLPSITYRLGGHDEQDFTSADLVVANPAVKPDHPLLRAARDHGVPVTTEIALLVQHLPNRQRTLGITGSAGKSTTTAMIGHVLKKSERGMRNAEVSTELSGTSAFGVPRSDFHTHVGGNLGGSLLPVVDTIAPQDWVVLELSSFMLHYLREIQWSPHIAVVTNLSPNHLDWHGTFENYAEAKRGIIEHQRVGDVAVIGPTLDAGFASHAVSRVVPVDRSIAVQTPLPGEHNRLNAQTAATALQQAGIAFDPQRDLVDFAGLTHRLQYVGERDGVRFFNDSKSTTPEAAMLAIDAFPPNSVHIILGGYDKGSDLTMLATHAAQQCAGVYTIGVTGDRIADEAGTIAMRCGTLETAVREAFQRATVGQVVVLSPGCASWDQFENYEQRGERFIALCKQAGVR